MSLKILFFDELRGFYKSKIMIILWVGLPILSIILNLLRLDTEGVPLSYFVGLFIASIGGTLSSVMLSTSITSEINRQVFNLFLIRPVKRESLLIAKYLAVFSCLVIATLITLIVGVFIDWITTGIPQSIVLIQSMESLGFSLAAMSISCSVGIIIGISVKNVAASAILSVYVGNQFSLISILPSVFLPGILNPLIFSGSIGILLTALLMGIGIIIFKNKEL
jgi:ABC-2 type transport system permease protein